MHALLRHLESVGFASSYSERLESRPTRISSQPGPSRPLAATWLGWDHMFDFPGADDFNIAWEPIVVLFKNKADANEHMVTDDRINELYAQGKVDLIPLPGATFLCAVVPQRIWNMATPVPNG